MTDGGAVISNLCVQFLLAQTLISRRTRVASRDSIFRRHSAHSGSTCYTKQTPRTSEPGFRNGYTVLHCCAGDDLGQFSCASTVQPVFQMVVLLTCIPEILGPYTRYISRQDCSITAETRTWRQHNISQKH